MRADQFAKLVELQETLMDVFLAEVKPEEWPGADYHIAKMSQIDRGNRLWCKKNASHTLSIVTKLSAVIYTERRIASTDPNMPSETADDSIQTEAEQEADEETMILAYETAATQAMKRIVKKSREQ